MHRVDTSTAVATLPAQDPAGTPGFFTKGNVGGGLPATVPGQDWFNAVQEELIGFLSEAGISPSKADHTQLAQILRRIRFSNWYQHQTNKNFYLSAVAYGTAGGLPVAVAVGAADGADAYLLVSDQFFSLWQEITNPKNITLNGVVFHAAKFISVGGPDGVDAYIIVASSLSTWVEKSNPKNFGLNAIDTNGTRLVAVGGADGADAYIVVSDDDGETWGERSNPQNLPLFGVKYFSRLGKWIAVGGDGSNTYILTSVNGDSWIQAAFPAGGRRLYSVADNGSRLVAVGVDSSANVGKMLISDDGGDNWSAGVLEGTETMNSVIAQGSRFVISGQSGSQSRIQVSDDNAESFDSFPPPPTAQGSFLQILSINGTILGVGSSDGTKAIIATSFRF